MTPKNTLAILVIAVATATGAHAAAPKKQAPAAVAKAPDPAAKKIRDVRDLFSHLVNGPTGKPGVWLSMDGRIYRYSKSATGYVRTASRVGDAGQLQTQSEVAYTINEADGTYSSVAASSRYTVEVERDGSSTFRTKWFKQPYSLGDDVYLYGFRFSGDVLETNSNGEADQFVWRSEAEAREHQAVIAQANAARAELKRRQDQLVAMQADFAREQRMRDELAQREAAQAEQDAQVAHYEGERVAANAEWEAEARQRQQDLEDSIQRLRDSTAQYEAVAKRLSAVPSPAPKGASRADVTARTGTEAASGATRSSEASSAGAGGAGNASTGSPLRVVLDIGMRNKPGDRNNPTCYSNVITREKLPGWGQRGFVPPESARRARELVMSMKAGFIAQCRVVSGREITSEGNFHWTWNELPDGDQQVSGAGPKYPEDFTVRAE